MKKLLTILLLLALCAPQALAMTKERAEALVKAADPRAKSAKQFWIYPEGDGAWVFYATGYKSPLFKGTFWYVTEDKQTQLGDYTQNVYAWERFDSEPPAFYSNTLYDEMHHPHLAFLKDGAPFEIVDMGTLTSLYEFDGSIVGLDAQDLVHSDHEWIFLGIEGDRLVEIAANPISEAEALGFQGMDDILEELLEGNDVIRGGVIATDFLFRNAAPGRYKNAQGFVQGSITLNVDDHGKPGRVYIFIDEKGTAFPERGWENEISIDEGTAKARYGVGLEIVETVTE